jgi:tripartite-type tricarboxylate transporter receptor subunit TctC
MLDMLVRDSSSFLSASAIALWMMSAATTTASAQNPDIEAFYRGKTLSMIIGYPVGGANDNYARTLARHIGKHIPGNPAVVAKNMQGGGSVIAANYMANTAPRDGTVLSLLAATAPLEEALGASGVKYKAAEFNWIGRMASAVNATIVMASAPVKSLDDAYRHEVILAGTGRAATTTVYPSVLNKVLGLRFKVVVGFEGSIAAFLAMERGEVEGHSTSWDGIKSARASWVEEKKVNVIVQYGIHRHPELPDVPTSVELGRTDAERQVLRIVANATEIGKTALTTPGVPADRVEALRRAFDATMTDPDYVAEMKKLQLEIIPLGGEELQKLAQEVGNVPPDVLQKVKAIYPLN